MPNQFTCPECGVAKKNGGRCLKCHRRHIAAVADARQPNPSRLCQCGCGQQTSGKERRFVRGHHRVNFAIPRDRYQIDEETGCWVWLGCTAGSGYAQFKYRRKRVSIHRLSYELHRGPIPKGLTIDHLCRNTLCINPDHLEAVTVVENLKRGHKARGHHIM
jgi:hypothetical protein